MLKALQYSQVVKYYLFYMVYVTIQPIVKRNVGH